jgi:hypothetical protein
LEEQVRKIGVRGGKKPENPATARNIFDIPLGWGVDSTQIYLTFERPKHRGQQK